MIIFNITHVTRQVLQHDCGRSVMLSGYHSNIGLEMMGNRLIDGKIEQGEALVTKTKTGDRSKSRSSKTTMNRIELC